MSARVRPFLALAAALALTACTTPPDTPLPLPLVWPGAPDAPRVAYVQAFSRPEDLGIQKGMMQRLGELLFGAENARIVRPTAVLESAGVIYVADPGAKGVHRFDRAGARYELLHAAGKQPLPSPVGLAAGANGEVYVTDSALAKVLVIRPGAKFATELPLRHRLGQPTGIAADPTTGTLYVVDTARHQLLLFDRDGALTATVGERGRGDGQFNFPTLLWRDAAGRLYVTDALNFRVQILDARGQFLSKFGRQGDGSGDMARHKGIATDGYGHIYLADGLFHALQIFDPSGRFLLSIGGQGRDRGEFWLPVGVYIGSGDTIYVADSYNQRVQVFRYIGGPS